LDNRDEHIERLIVRYFSGEALPEEAIELEEWVDESPEHRKYFEEYRFISNNTGQKKKYTKVDTLEAWQKISGQMKSPAISLKKKARNQGSMYNRIWLAMAASFTLIIGLSLFMIFNRRPDNMKLLTSSELISKDSIIFRKVSPTVKAALNRKTIVIYSSDKTGKKNELNITGEAFLDIRHSKDTSVIVRADETIIHDIGTSFNVMAYPSDNEIRVFVESGKVKFYTAELKGIIVDQGETGIYNKTEKKFVLKTDSDPNITSYKTSTFIFRNDSLSKVVSILNSVYYRKIILAEKDLADQKITVTFKNESVDTIAEIIAETLSLKVKSDSTTIILDHE
jgi:transmembrane sensor